MAYTCTECTETYSLANILGVVIRLLIAAFIAWFLYNHGGELSQSILKTINK